MTRAMPPSPRLLSLDGYTDIPAGKIAAVVTYLEMRGKPPLTEPPGAGRTLDPIGADLARYRDLFRRVGAPWLWFSRLAMAPERLSALLAHPAVEAYALRDPSGDIGLLELEFRPAGECRLAFLGLVPEAIGRGAGRHLMNEAIRRAFSAPVGRFHVQTCSLDHPAALAFYLRSGFVPYRRAVEVADDPRLAGHLPREAAPHVPVIAPVIAPSRPLRPTAARPSPPRPGR